MNIVSPQSVYQNTDKSIVNEKGIYDFTRFSKNELNTIASVIKNAESGKYPPRLIGLGLANEAYPIIYKPRYIVHEIIIQKYKYSKNPYDMLAVAAAYSSKGAMFRENAIKYYELYLSKANVIQKERAKKYFFRANEPFFSHHLAELYEQTYQFDKALKYAIFAESKNTSGAPAYPQLISQIYLKTDVAKCIEYLSAILESDKYKSFHKQIEKELERAIKVSEEESPYKPRPYKPSKNKMALEEEISRAASEFLPGGTYYKYISER